MLVIFGPIRQDHVVYGQAIVEAALLIEVRDLRSGIWRPLFSDVCESAAVAHRFQTRILQGGNTPSPRHA